jgi:type IV secretory pathway VirB2 component (pilin)
MIKKITKLGILILTVATLLFSSVAYMAHAAEPTDPNKPHTSENLEQLQFNVGKYLQLPGENPGDKPKQSQDYFKPNEDGTQTFPTIKFITDVIELMTKIAGTLAVIMLILTGFVMMFSQGNQNAIEKAKSMFLYSILGTVVIFLSYMLVTLVQSIFTNI